MPHPPPRLEFKRCLAKSQSRAEAAASAENTASISAIRASLEEELSAKDGVIRSANEARERALDETRERCSENFLR